MGLGIEGRFRFPTAESQTHAGDAIGAEGDSDGAAAVAHPEPKAPVAALLESAQRLVPGESLAGYLGVKSAAETLVGSGITAESYPSSLAVIAWMFLGVTIFLRVFGTMDPKSPKPYATIQWSVVAFSAAAFVALVLSAKGRFWTGAALGPDGEVLALAVTAVLGIVVPVVYSFKAARTAA